MDIANLICKRTAEMKPSGIRRFFDIANEMEGVISLGVGEPDFKTPYAIRKAAIDNLQNPLYRKLRLSAASRGNRKVYGEPVLAFLRSA